MSYLRNNRLALFVGGTTGAGKTTLVRNLRTLGDVYIERGEANPHLHQLGEYHQFNARANQHWFLDQVEQFLHSFASPIGVLDQHLPGIAIAYTQYFLNQGLLSLEFAEEIRLRASRILQDLASNNVAVLHVHLTASSACLWDRLQKRDSHPRFSLDELSHINRLFQALVFPSPCMPINTEVLSSQEVVSAVSWWLKNPSVTPTPLAHPTPFA